MITLLMGLAVIAAVAAVGLRRWQRARRLSRRPGASLLKPVIVQGFDEIDAAVEAQACAWCGGRLVNGGETSRNAGERRFRIVRAVCRQCERELAMYFDVTRVFH